MNNLITPFGGNLVNLLVPANERDDAIEEANRMPSIQLSERSTCDLELLATGGFSPLESFMGQADYESVSGEMRLCEGTLFPIPISLAVEPFADLSLDRSIALRDSHNEVLATMRFDEIYDWSKADFAENVLGSTDPRHPLVAESQNWGRYNLAGKLRVIKLPKHVDFNTLRLTPSQTRKLLASRPHKNIVAFQTRNPMHRIHEEMTKSAAAAVNGSIFLHPVVGLTRPGDVDYFTRVRTYRILTERYYDPQSVLLALLPLAMRMAGPREAVWHSIIRRNFGATHFIVGRDHAGPGLDSKGKLFYPPEAAQELATLYADEIGVKMVPFGEMVFSPDDDRYVEKSKVPFGKRSFSLSGTQIREDYLGRARPLPEWFTRREIGEILGEAYPPSEKQGICIWFTGLSGSGKSATAEILAILLNEKGRRVTILDGDVVRTHLSKGLGFSKEDRDINILRIGFVAAEIVKHGGIAICAAVSPYRSTRNEVRQMIGTDRFIEIFVDTPFDICENRDTKGMYAKARRGEISGFTGIDDPYERPENAEITIETTSRSIDENAYLIMEHLSHRILVRSGN